MNHFKEILSRKPDNISDTFNDPFMRHMYTNQTYTNEVFYSIRFYFIVRPTKLKPILNLLKNSETYSLIISTGKCFFKDVFVNELKLSCLKLLHFTFLCHLYFLFFHHFYFMPFQNESLLWINRNKCFLLSTLEVFLTVIRYLAFIKIR